MRLKKFRKNARIVALHNFTKFDTCFDANIAFVICILYVRFWTLIMFIKEKSNKCGSRLQLHEYMNASSSSSISWHGRVGFEGITRVRAAASCVSKATYL